MTNNKIIWAAFGLVGAAALAAGLYFGNPSTESGSVAADAARTLFGVTLPDAAGKDQPLAQWRGKVLVVNFWATWCVPCREEMPLFDAAQKRFSEKELQFVGIAADPIDKMRQFVEDFPVSYPTVAGGYGAIELSKVLGNKIGALPYTVIVDRAGRIVYTQLGPFTEAKLNSILSGAL